MLTPQTEVFLSYLTGLGPVGEPIEPRLDHAMADLGYGQKVSIYARLNELIKAGFVVKHLKAGRKRTDPGGPRIGLLTVVRRLESSRYHLPVVPPPETPHIVHLVEPGRVPHSHWLKRIAEIPDDTRNLTQRMLGDPLPGRDALSRRAAKEAALHG